MSRRVGVVTTARSDYGIYLPVLRAIQADPQLELFLIAGGMHLSPEFGHTVDAITSDGFAIGDRVEMLLSSDSALGTATSMGLGVMAFAQSYERNRPDLLLVLGDRFEMHAAVVASVPFGIPVAHIHGGEVTEGAIDDALRHGITKIAHLHFTSTQAYADRVIRMGEEPWRVHVSGAPSLDNLATVELLDATQLQARFGVAFDKRPLLVTYHPVTRDVANTKARVAAFFKALESVDREIVFTLPNADPSGHIIRDGVVAFASAHPNAHIIDNLGTEAYFSAMNAAGAMVGNSSSGIIEAASFSLPVVNIGTRQSGRIRPANVIDVAEDLDATVISEAIRRALEPSFASALRGLTNPYGNGSAAETITKVLRETKLDARLIQKRFHDAG